MSSPSHHWRRRIADIPVWVRGDPARLHQVLSNLLVNARIHTPAGVTVTTSVTAGTDHAELTVSDNGPGIGADLLPTLFDRFVRADTARSREVGGTGLGLAIVASIVAAHDGTVSVESNSSGTVFRIQLPLLQKASN